MIYRFAVIHIKYARAPQLVENKKLFLHHLFFLATYNPTHNP
jgi:hypothetical protein